MGKMNLGQFSDQSAQPGLAVGKLVKMEELFPSVDEQMKIGRNFESIDNLIALMQRKLEKLQSLKSVSFGDVPAIMRRRDHESKISNSRYHRTGHSHWWLVSVLQFSIHNQENWWYNNNRIASWQEARTLYSAVGA